MSRRSRRVGARCSGADIGRAMGAVVAFALLTSAVLSGCHGRGLVDDGYPGAALATGHGSLEATAEPVRDPVSLAIAWRAAEAADPLAALASDLEAIAKNEAAGDCVPLAKLGGADAVWKVESVTHSTALPFQFKFSLLTGPPRETEVDLERLGGSGRAAVGMVIAFADADRDGDYRPENDGNRLVALSASRARTQLVAFVDGRAPERWGVDQGFNLVTRAAGADHAEVSRLDEAWVDLSPELVGSGRLCP